MPRALAFKHASSLFYNKLATLQLASPTKRVPISQLWCTRATVNARWALLALMPEVFLAHRVVRVIHVGLLESIVKAHYQRFSGVIESVVVPRPTFGLAATAIPRDVGPTFDERFTFIASITVRLFVIGNFAQLALGALAFCADGVAAAWCTAHPGAIESSSGTMTLFTLFAA
jgi:hypothetical protein